MSLWLQYATILSTVISWSFAYIRSLVRSTLVKWIELPSKLCNSAIHKAARSLVTGRPQKYQWQERPPEAIPPLMASLWNDGIVPGKSNHGMAGNHEAGGFVNSAVRVSCAGILGRLLVCTVNYFEKG